MFDVAPQELLLVAIVALLVIGPKDLPKAMRFVGHWVGKARGVARQFRSGIDTMIREFSDDARSLDDFAAAFFGMDDGSYVTRPYDFAEVVATLGTVAAHDWAGFLIEKLERKGGGAPLGGVERVELPAAAP